MKTKKTKRRRGEKPQRFEGAEFVDCLTGEVGLFGYARVSTRGQQLEPQVDLLREAGCRRIYMEKVSSLAYRKAWHALLDQVRPGDTVAVVRLDRIGRRIKEVITCVSDLVEQGVHVRALQQGIDTGKPPGTLLVGIFAALAETEREVLSERTREGLAAAEKRGRRPGRPPKLDDAKRKLIAHLAGRGFTLDAIVVQSKLSRSTVRRALEELRERKTAKQMRLAVDGEGVRA